MHSVLRFAGVDITAAPIKLPASPHPLPSSGPVTLAQARAAASFPIGVPASLGAPERVEIADPAPNGSSRVVSLFYRSGAIRLDEFDGTLDGGFLKSVRDADWVQIRGETALWMPTPHPVEYVDRAGMAHTETGRMAGPTLLWQSNSVTFRLEGFASRDDAIAVASSTGP